jgi:SAM-dependent methyltransferase
MAEQHDNDPLEAGLKIGWICGEYLLKLEHLHYGYWTEELQVDIANLRSAQEAYVTFLLSHIPESAKTILDVGCGAGRVARRLLAMGYEVDCVSPSGFLAAQTRRAVGDRCEIFECGYEQLKTEKRYDLILFVESLQYIDLPQALAKTSKFLNAGGSMLICDVFRRAADGAQNAKRSGGHDLTRFFKLIEAHPFMLAKDVDITDQTAPNIDLFNEAIERVARPVVDSIAQFVAERYPTVFKLLGWKYQQEMEKISARYSGGIPTGEHFKKSRSYRLLCYRKRDGECVDA